MKTKTKKFTICVTKKDIRNGIQEDAGSCPIALALDRKLKLDSAPEVNREGIELQLKPNSESVYEDSYSFGIPKKCGRFVERFDAGKKVKPFKFLVRVPVDILKRAQ